MAQLDRPAITAKINTFITENTSGAITATQMNEILRDIADSCFNIDSDESLPPSLVDVLSQGNSTQGNGINLTTNDGIYNEEIPFFLGYVTDDDENLMVMGGVNNDKAAAFFLKEELGELEARMTFLDFNTGSDHSFSTNISGLELKSDNSDYSTQVNITPFEHVSRVYNELNRNNTDISQSHDSIENYVRDSDNYLRTNLRLFSDEAFLINGKNDGLEQSQAHLSVNHNYGVNLRGSRSDGTNYEGTDVEVKPEFFVALKNNHMLLVDPDFNSVGTGFYTADGLGLLSQFSIDHRWINLNSTDQNLNKSVSVHVEHQNPTIDLVAISYESGNLIQSTANVYPAAISLSNYSMLTPNLARAFVINENEIKTFLTDQTSPSVADHFTVGTSHTINGVHTKCNYNGLNKYSESYVFKDLIKLYNATDSDSINVMIANGAVEFEAYDGGDVGQTSIDLLGVSTSGSYVLNEFKQGLGNSSSGFAVLWYDAPVAHTEPVMTIGSWNPETSTGIGMQISEYGMWSNMESSYQADQYFLEDIYVQNGRVFIDNADAATNGLPLNAMYVTPTGEVRVRI